MHYNAGSYVAVDGNTGNRPRSGTDRTSFQDDEAGAAFPFPHLSPDSEAARQISINFIANILGLGWAATPAGLKAMEELKKKRRDPVMAALQVIRLQQPRICAPF